MNKLWNFLSLLLSIGTINMSTHSQDTNIWDPKFQKILLSQSVGTKLNEIISYEFKQYWPSYPFTINYKQGPIIIFPQIGPPPIAQNDPNAEWDENWIGEVFIGEKGVEDSLESVATFNRTNQSQGISIPVNKVKNSNIIFIYVYGFRDGNKLIYDRFMFSISTNEAIDEELGQEIPSGPVIQIPCYVTNLSSSYNSFESSGGSYSFSVNVSKSDCSWTITKNVDWIQLPENLNRIGSSEINYSVFENNTDKMRIGLISFGGIDHTVVQSGKEIAVPPQEPCYSMQISTPSSIFQENGGTASFAIASSKESCPWTVSKNVEWITFSGSTSKTGSSVVEFSVAKNQTNDIRVGSVIAFNHRHNVIQLPKEKEPQIIEVPVEVIIEVPVEVIKEVPVEVIKEVPVEVIVEVPIEVIKEVPVEVIVEVPIKEDPEIKNILLNVIKDNRIFNSTNLFIVSENSKDPLIDSDSGVGTKPIYDENLTGVGKLYSWGRNNVFQFGNGTTISSISPSLTNDNSVWVEVAAGTDFACGVDKNGDLFSWGNNTNGQLGHGDTINRSRPIKINSEEKWKSVSCGRSHVIALSANGEIYSWGRNIYGQLGTNNTRNSLSPIKISSIKNDWVYVFASLDSSYAIDKDGKLYAWGYNNRGQLGNGTTKTSLVPVPINPDISWKKIVSGESHTIAITTNGELYSWGRNNRGQLANGFVSINNILSPSKISNENNWVDVGAGFESSFFLNSKGELYSAGLNNYGQLGLGNLLNQSGLNKLNLNFLIKKISSGYYHSIAISDSGEMYSWGRNEGGQLGIENNSRFASVPTKINKIKEDVVSVSCGSFFTVAVIGKFDILENEEEGDRTPIEFQSVIHSLPGSQLSISWEGNSLEEKLIKILLKRKSSILIDQTYTPSDLESKRILIDGENLEEYLLKIELQDQNKNSIQTKTTKFIISKL